MSQIGESKIPDIDREDFVSEVDAAYTKWAGFATQMLIHDENWPQEIRTKVNTIAYWLGELHYGFLDDEQKGNPE